MLGAMVVINKHRMYALHVVAVDDKQDKYSSFEKNDLFRMRKFFHKN